MNIRERLWRYCPKPVKRTGPYILARAGFDRFGEIMKRRLAVLSRVLIIALVILALLLDYSATFFPTINDAPTAATGVALLITVILCLSVSLWAAFVDKAKPLEGGLVLVGLILGTLLFWFSLFLSTDELNWMNRIQATAATINNESIVIDCLSTITIILGLAAIAAFGLILRRSRSRALPLD